MLSRPKKSTSYTHAILRSEVDALIATVDGSINAYRQACYDALIAAGGSIDTRVSVEASSQPVLHFSDGEFFNKVTDMCGSLYADIKLLRSSCQRLSHEEFSDRIQVLLDRRLPLITNIYNAIYNKTFVDTSNSGDIIKSFIKDYDKTLKKDRESKQMKAAKKENFAVRLDLFLVACQISQRLSCLREVILEEFNEHILKLKGEFKTLFDIANNDYDDNGVYIRKQGNAANPYVSVAFVSIFKRPDRINAALATQAVPEVTSRSGSTISASQAIASR